MWVITVFEKDTYRMYEFTCKNEATTALESMNMPAMLSYTR